MKHIIFSEAFAMSKNPFIVEPLSEWNVDILYVNRDEEKEVMPYLSKSNVVHGMGNKIMITSQNFIVIGTRGSGKSSFMAHLKKQLSSNTQHPIIISPPLIGNSIREFLGRLYVEMLKTKANKTDEDLTLLEENKQNMSYRAFSTDFLLKELHNNKVTIFIDSAQGIFKYSNILDLITSTGHEYDIKWGLFMTPRAYYLWRGNKDHDGFFDRFNLAITLSPMTFEQAVEMIQKRLIFSGMQDLEFLSDVQIRKVVDSLNGIPRAIMKTCKILFDYKLTNNGNSTNQITDFQVLNAVASVKLEELDIQGLDEEYKIILKVFMANEGFATTSELLMKTGLTRPTLYRKLNYLRAKGHIFERIDECGHNVRGEWELDQTTASMLAFGANGEFVKSFEDQE